MSILKLLVFIGTEGIYHDHVGQGKFIADMLSQSDGISADVERNYQILSKNLDDYDALLFYTDIGVLTSAQETKLLDFINRGGGFIGLHTAAASFRKCEGYHDMLNAFFDGHSKNMDFAVNIIDNKEPITQGLEDFVVTDELYYLKHDPTISHHLMEAYDPAKDEVHVIAFTHEYGNGRVFYFALGHDMVATKNPSFQKILRRGVLWSGQRL